MSTADRSVITIDYKGNLLYLGTQRDGDRNERRREWERTGEAASQGWEKNGGEGAKRWSGENGLGVGGLKRDRQVHRGEKNMVHLPYLILSGPRGVEHKTRSEKEGRAVRGGGRQSNKVCL